WTTLSRVSMALAMVLALCSAPATVYFRYIQAFRGYVWPTTFMVLQKASIVYCGLVILGGLGVMTYNTIVYVGIYNKGLDAFLAAGGFTSAYEALYEYRFLWFQLYSCLDLGVMTLAFVSYGCAESVTVTFIWLCLNTDHVSYDALTYSASVSLLLEAIALGTVLYPFQARQTQAVKKEVEGSIRLQDMMLQETRVRTGSVGAVSHYV
ncbi:hypothetical protein KIPB_007691, partial [Kipferlia bialata]